MVSCPTDEELCAFAESSADAKNAQAIGEHVEECGDCRVVLAILSNDNSQTGSSVADTEVTGHPWEESQTNPGKNIGRFIVERQIGSGGMGRVYLASDPKLNRQIAIKVLHSDLSERHGRRLRSEARAMAGLSHPALLPVFEVGEHEGAVYLAMEYVPGSNLRQWLRLHTPSWREIVQLFAAVGAGLSAAHKAGLIHRDFKPDNVLVGDDGRARVADFGLAKWIDEEKLLLSDPEYSHTAVHTIMGTPGYMAPEQVEGLEHTPAIDQFSYCVALFEALFKQRPFLGLDPRSCHQAVLRGDIAQVSLGDIPAGLHAAICRGLQRRSTDRFPDMDQLLPGSRAFLPRRDRRRALSLSRPFVVCTARLKILLRARRGAKRSPCRDFSRQPSHDCWSLRCWQVLVR